MRYLYSALFYLILPFLFVRLLLRSYRQPAYRRRLAERIGYYPQTLEKCIWIHAVSVGEALASVPLIKALQSQFPHVPCLVTTMTPTGAATVKAALGDSIHHAYLPYDVPDAMMRFFKSFNPMIGIIMETELWPNLLAICQQRKIPLCLMNARLSQQSARKYAYIAAFTRTMLQKFTVIAANGKRDAQRFIALGASKDQVIITGNIKFDLEIPNDLIHVSRALQKSIGDDRFIWIAASTHEGEEAIFLSAHQKIREVNPHALLILVPRHPNRFESIAKLCKQSFATVRRSEGIPCGIDTALYLGDTMGELLLMYGAATVAVVGGSFIPQIGGHNILEPAALAKPILTGPYLFNFAEISDCFVKARALIKVTDADSLAKHLLQLMTDADERISMGERAKKVVAANRGALSKQLAIVNRVMSQKLSSRAYS